VKSFKAFSFLFIDEQHSKPLVVVPSVPLVGCSEIYSTGGWANHWIGVVVTTYIFRSSLDFYRVIDRKFVRRKACLLVVLMHTQNLQQINDYFSRFSMQFS
jgi:hypothetical protein